MGGESCIVGALRSAGLRSTDLSLLPQHDDGWRERVHRVDEHIVCVSCGLVPDARQLLRALQRLAQEHRRSWGTRMPVGLVAARLSEYVQSATQRASTRPFGAAFLLAGYDDDEGCFKLYRTDPAGFFDEVSDAAIIAGDAPAAARDTIHRSYRAGLDANGLTLLLCDALAASRGVPESSSELRPTDVEVARLTFRENKLVSDILTFEQIAAILADRTPSPEEELTNLAMDTAPTDDIENQMHDGSESELDDDEDEATPLDPDDEEIA